MTRRKGILAACVLGLVLLLVIVVARLRPRAPQRPSAGPSSLAVQTPVGALPFAGVYSLREEKLGPMPPTDAFAASSLVSSRDYLHLSWIARENEKKRAFVDGVAGPLWDDIRGRVVFSPDSRRYTYVAQEGTQMRVVVDGVPGPPYKGIDPDDVLFSADSKHVLYAALKESSDGLETVNVLDGKEAARHAVVGRLAFSPDSKRTAWFQDPCRVIVDGTERATYGQWDTGLDIGFSPDSKRVAWTVALNRQGTRVVVGGVEGELFQRILSGPEFSPDSAHVAYQAARGREEFLVIDGKVDGPYDRVRMPTFAADSTRFAYRATRDGKELAVIDGKPDAPCDRVDGPEFSPDSTRVAYVATRGKKDFAVIDGKAGGPYDDVQMLKFSPDSRRTAYLGCVGEDCYPVVDGVKGKPYREPSGSSGSRVLFSPDSRHLAFTVGTKDARGVMAVVDGVEQKLYREIEHLVFSPDSKHLAYRALGPSHYELVLDGEEKPFEEHGGSRVSFSPDSEHMAYIRRKRLGQAVKFALVLDGREGPEYGAILKLTFSPDSMHLAYVAKGSDGLDTVIVDGKEYARYDQHLGGYGEEGDPWRQREYPYSDERTTFRADGRIGFLGFRGGSLYRFWIEPLAPGGN